MGIGDRIKSLRERLELSQQQFGHRFHASKQTVSHWEKDRNLPKPPTLAKMAKEGHTTVEWILHGVEGNRWTFLAAQIQELPDEKQDEVGEMIEGILRSASKHLPRSDHSERGAQRPSVTRGVPLPSTPLDDDPPSTKDHRLVGPPKHRGKAKPPRAA